MHHDAIVSLTYWEWLGFACRRFLTVTDSYDGDRFFTERNNKRVATPLLLALAVVEISDVVFAVDSIPAVSHSHVHHDCTPAC